MSVAHGHWGVQMDDLLPPSYSPFQAFFSADGQEFLSPCDSSDLEKLLGSDDVVLDNRDDEVPRGGTGATSLPPAAAPPVTERRRPGRKPGSVSSRAAGTTAISHMQAERLRRDRLNRLFCDLRAAVPTVSRMDRASLLADAAGYIAMLRGRIEQLQAEAAEASKRTTTAAPSHSQSQHSLLIGGGSGQELEVRMHGRDDAAAAALRLTTTAAATRHAPARLMAALRALDLPVQHAPVCRVGGVTVQDVVVDVPAAGLRGEDSLRTALLHKLLQESRQMARTQ